ncbi:hypothetical protein tb265_03450 [Gemmatimonadetes bacterium T265]|nr:hypothetical protein tb265_03450 [Gemmatimonadetes bacterium T265]
MSIPGYSMGDSSGGEGRGVGSTRLLVARSTDGVAAVSSQKHRGAGIARFNKRGGPRLSAAKPRPVLYTIDAAPARATQHTSCRVRRDVSRHPSAVSQATVARGRLSCPDDPAAAGALSAPAR